jgi:hypothetical protein
MTAEILKVRRWSGVMSMPDFVEIDQQVQKLNSGNVDSKRVRSREIGFYFKDWKQPEKAIA